MYVCAVRACVRIVQLNVVVNWLSLLLVNYTWWKKEDTNPGNNRYSLIASKRYANFARNIWLCVLCLVQIIYSILTVLVQNWSLPVSHFFLFGSYFLSLFSSRSFFFSSICVSIIFFCGFYSIVNDDDDNITALKTSE